jgi:hypothetical protein
MFCYVDLVEQNIVLQGGSSVNTISKKELLDLTGISYGQLYRWKREGLIPEEWFVKQSSFTGQETFFPREEILGRISAILELKDAHSLEELAGILSGDCGRFVSVERLKGLGIFSDPAFGDLSDLLIPASSGVKNSEISFGVAAFAYGFTKLAIGSGVPRAETARLVREGVTLLGECKFAETVCTLFRAGEDYHLCLSRGTVRPSFDGGLTVIGALPLSETVSELTTALKGA